MDSLPVRLAAVARLSWVLGAAAVLLLGPAPGALAQVPEVVIERDSGDEPSSAIGIEPGAVYMADASDDSDVDTYVLHVAEAGVYLLTLQGSDDLDVDLSLEALEGSGAHLPQGAAQSALSAGRMDALRRYLTPGRYLVSVVAYQGAPAGYRLAVLPGQDDGSDSPQSAIALEDGTEQAGAFEEPGDVDYYRFSMEGGPSQWGVLLAWMGADTDDPDAAFTLTLLGPDGEVIESAQSSQAYASIQTLVRPATYGLQAAWLDANGPLGYRLMAAAVQPKPLAMGESDAPVVEDGDSFYYLLELPSATALEVRLTWPSAGDDLDLYVKGPFVREPEETDEGPVRAAGQPELFASTEEETNEEALARLWQPGRYLAWVYGYAVGAPTRGHLQVRLLESDGNDAMEQAVELGLAEPQPGYIELAGDQDFFAFGLANPSQVTVELTVPPEVDYDLELLDSAGRLLDESRAASGEPERIDRALASGEYFVRVHSYEGHSPETPYVLRLTVAQVQSGEPGEDRLGEPAPPGADEPASPPAGSSPTPPAPAAGPAVSWWQLVAAGLLGAVVAWLLLR